MGRTSITTNLTGRVQKAFLLQETFDKLLLEDGNGILLEKSVNNFNTGRTPITTILN